MQGSAETSLRGVLDVLPDLAFVHRAGIILYANRAIADALGYAVQDIAGRPLTDLLHPQDHERVRQRTSAAMAGEVNPRATFRVRSKAGTELLVETRSVRCDFTGGPAILVLGHDLTLQRKLEAQLALADRMTSMGTLAAGVAHEINNPLGYVLGNLGYLADGLAKLRGLGAERGVDVAALEQALHEVWDGAKRVRDIVHDLKTFSRSDSERRELVDLRRAIEAAVRLSQNEIKHTATLRVDLGRLPPVEADSGRLTQVFVNLLINAAQAMPQRPSSENQIEVRGRVQDGSVVVEVADNGVGMTPDVRAHLFDPFFTTKPVGVGTGLGLSICLATVERMRGRLEVESEEGRGATFRIVLPSAVAEASVAVPVPDSVPPPGRCLTVLVIDDEPLVGTSIRRVLTGEHTVEVFTSSSEALARLEAGPPVDVILCDLMMPGLTGMDLHAEVQRRMPQLEARMAFLSGGTFTRRASEFMGRMRDRTLPKPFTTEALRRLLSRLAG